MRLGEAPGKGGDRQREVTTMADAQPVEGGTLNVPPSFPLLVGQVREALAAYPEDEDMVPDPAELPEGVTLPPEWVKKYELAFERVLRLHDVTQTLVGCLERSHTAPPPPPPDQWLILSLKWSGPSDAAVWYKPEANGYTTDVNKAGRFPLAKAMEHQLSDVTLAVPERCVLDVCDEVKLVHKSPEIFMAFAHASKFVMGKPT